MARRASSSTSPAWFAGALILVIAFAVGGYWIYSFVSDPLRTVPELPVRTYLENSNSLRGNSYQIEGVIANQLGWSADQGRLFSLDLDSGDGSGDVVPVFVPARFNSVNIQKGQRFIFEVEVIEKGILSAKSFDKT